VGLVKINLILTLEKQIQKSSDSYLVDLMSIQVRKGMDSTVCRKVFQWVAILHMEQR
jgi:hypothetical protein